MKPTNVVRCFSDGTSLVHGDPPLSLQNGIWLGIYIEGQEAIVLQARGWS